jgi:hypothetical protein
MFESVKDTFSGTKVRLSEVRKKKEFILDNKGFE